MKKFNVLVSVFVIGIALISACGGTPQATEPPTEPSQPPAATEPPSLTEIPIQVKETPTLVQVPVDLSGPPMEVGSKIAYLDTTLVAVPGGPFTMGHGGPD